MSLSSLSFSASTCYRGTRSLAHVDTYGPRPCTCRYRRYRSRHQHVIVIVIALSYTGPCPMLTHTGHTHVVVIVIVLAIYMLSLSLSHCRITGYAYCDTHGPHPCACRWHRYLSRHQHFIVIVIAMLYYGPCPTGHTAIVPAIKMLSLSLSHSGVRPDGSSGWVPEIRNPAGIKAT